MHQMSGPNRFYGQWPRQGYGQAYGYQNYMQGSTAYPGYHPMSQRYNMPQNYNTQMRMQQVFIDQHFAYENLVKFLFVLLVLVPYSIPQNCFWNIE